MAFSAKRHNAPTSSIYPLRNAYVLSANVLTVFLTASARVNIANFADVLQRAAYLANARIAFVVVRASCANEVERGRTK